MRLSAPSLMRAHRVLARPPSAGRPSILINLAQRHYATAADRPQMPVSSHRPRAWPVGPKLNRPMDTHVQNRPAASLDLVRWNRRITETVRRGDLRVAQQQLVDMDAQGCRPNQLTYSVLIDGYARMQKFDQAQRLLEEMKQRNISPNTVTYNALVNGYCRAERLQDALQLVSWMEGVGGDVAPNAVTYSTIINVYAKRGDISSVLKTLNRMKEMNLAPTAVTFNCVINACVKSDDVREAEVWLAEMLRSGCAPTSLTFVPLLTAYANAKDFSKVSACLKQMHDHNVALTQEVYVALARAFIRTGSEDQLDELSKQMRLQGLPPSRFLHNAIIDALVQAGRLDDAEAQVQRLLADGLEPNRYTYFPIFMAYTAKDQLPSAQRIFALMETTRGCEPDEPAYLRMGTAWTRVGQHAQARSVLDRLHARGKPTVFAANLYSAIVQGLAASGAPEQAEATVADMKTRNCVPSVQALMALAASWAAAGQSGRQAEVQAQLKSQGVELDDAQIASLQASWNATKKKAVPS